MVTAALRQQSYLPRIWDVTSHIPGIRNLAECETEPSDLPLLYYIRVTPALAQTWLDNNRTVVNRHYQSHLAIRYARDMANEDWTLGVAGIAFAETGDLLDGQHRLHAVVLAKIPVVMLVGFNVSSKSMPNIDTGKMRSLADIFTIEGKENATRLAAMISVLYVADHSGSFEERRHMSQTPSREEALRYYETHTDLVRAIPVARGLRRVIKNGLAGALYYTCWKKHGAAIADPFWERLGDGVDLGGTDIRHLLREILLTDRANQKKRMTERERRAIIIKGWNAYLNKRPVTRNTLRLIQGGEKPESFPTLL